MVSQHSTTPQSAKTAAGDSSDLATTEASKTSHGIAANENHSTPDSPQPKQSITMTILLLVSVLSSTFLIALDRTIISTAIPRITDDFNSLTDVGWYGSAYLLTFCAFQLLFGKMYTFFSVKAVLLASILLFEVASAICGAAPNSVTFIVGRAIAGVGAAGVMTGTVSLFGALFGLSAISGPLIGGAFTSNVTWRWCFYINLPLGGLAMMIIAPFLNIPGRDATKLSLAKKLVQLDALGTVLLVPGVVCLLLALQWGGQTYAWGNSRILALLTLAGVLLVAFTAIQILLPTTATLPPCIFKQRSVVAAFVSTLWISSGNYIFVYFLPIWFQSIKGVTAAESGIRLLPLMLSMVFGSISGGFINSKVGYYTPLAIIGSCIMSVGAGLLTTLQVHTGETKWIGYQVLYGIGLGLCFQVPNLATQTTLPKKDVPTGLALMLFGQLLGAAVFVAVGENVLTNQLVQRLSGIPEFNSSLITSGGATSLLGSLPTNLRETILIAYNEALRKVFQVGLIVSCFTVVGAATLEWRSVLRKPGLKVVADISGGAEEKVGETTNQGGRKP